MKKIILFLSLILITNLSYSARNPTGSKSCQSDGDCENGYCEKDASGAGIGYCVFNV